MSDNIAEPDSVSAQRFPKSTTGGTEFGVAVRTCHTEMKIGPSIRHLTEGPSSAAKAGRLSMDGENSKVGRKRYRASRRTPAVVISTEVYNFREMVQKYTGCEAMKESEHPDRPFFFKPMPQRAADQGLCGSHNTSFDYSAPCVLPPQSSFLPKFPFQPLAQLNKSPLLLPAFMSDKASNCTSHGQMASLGFEDLLKELGPNTSVF